MERHLKTVQPAAHVLAAGVWAGGLLVLAVVLRPVALLGHDERGGTALAAWRAFSPVAAVSSGVLLATGLYEAGAHVETWAALFRGVYGPAVLAKVAGGRELIEGTWQRQEAVVRPNTTGYATNVLRVEVGPDEVVFLANGKRLGAMPRSVLPRQGEVAFRMGASLNMHITIFDLITPMAPVPVRKTP